MLEIGTLLRQVGGLAGGRRPGSAGTVLFALDHHRGSEENQAGWEWHEPDLVDPAVGLIDTLPRFRRTIADAGLEASGGRGGGRLTYGRPALGHPLALLFIDGGHGTEPAHRDYELWTPHVEPGGLLCIHDVFPDPADGGRPPYEIYLPGPRVGRASPRSGPSAPCGCCAGSDAQTSCRRSCSVLSVEWSTRPSSDSASGPGPAARRCPGWW